MKKEKKEDIIVMLMLVAIMIVAAILGIVFVKIGFSRYSELNSLLENQVEPSILDYLSNLVWIFLTFIQVGIITKILNQIMLWKKGIGICNLILRYISLN